MPLLRAVVMIQPAGLGGGPASGQRATAATKASWTASSATSMSPKVRTSTATVVQRKDDELLTTDGPYVEGKEHLGGFTIVQAPDLDAALEWGRKLAVAIRWLPIEVRPFQGAIDH